MYTTYEEAREARVTREQARREIEKHGCSWADFLAECGDHPIYRGAVVLDWLGY